MSAIVQAESLSRFYGIVLGLNNVNLSIRPGITGIVGPNGAGKTTLFRLLTGQIRPSSGTLRVFGETPWNNPGVQARLAYCPESETVPPGIRPVEWLVGLGMISGLSAAEARGRAEASLRQVKLPPEHWGKRLTTLSKGMRQRVKLAQCLLHEPRLIILDEPMNGLDPMGREDFGRVLRELAAAGTSIIISSHILHDLEALCGEFLILSWGRIPAGLNAAASPEARNRWPKATVFRCGSPEKLARYFFDQGLLGGCEIDPAAEILRIRWSDENRFFADFDRWLLESGVAIYEVRSAASFLEQTMESPPAS
jgi:ABC-2 type transport system ATP-binding protein